MRPWSCLVLTALAAPALADPAPIAITTLDATKLPAGVKAKGKRVVGAHQWKAADGGDGVLVLSTTDGKGKLPSRQLFAQLFGAKAGAKLRELRLVQDGVPACQLDVVASFVTGSVQVIDVNGNGVPEVSFAYDINCSATYDPGPRKLIVLEGGAKHALRGRGMGTDPDAPPVGGDFKSDGFKGQAALETWAGARWKALLAVAANAVDP